MESPAPPSPPKDAGQPNAMEQEEVDGSGIITNIPVLHTAKRLKVEARKMDGMQRELYSLMGEHAAPVVVTPEVKGHARPEWQQKPAPWQAAPFSPKEGLTLHHWVRAAAIADGTSGYRFARFNKEPEVAEWKDEDFHLFDRKDWSLEETRYLFDLAKSYDLQWIVVADRYTFKRQIEVEDPAAKTSSDAAKGEKKPEGESKDTTGEAKTTGDDTQAGEPKSTDNTEESPKPDDQPKKPRTVYRRTVEEIKERYFEVCSALVRNKASDPESALSPQDNDLLRAMDFKRENEEKRKAHLERLLLRTPKEVAEEEALVLEARRLEALGGKLLLERQELMRILDAPANIAGRVPLKYDIGSSNGVGQLIQELSNEKSRTRAGAALTEAMNTKLDTLSTFRTSHTPNANTHRIVAEIVAATINGGLSAREQTMFGIAPTDTLKSKAPGVFLRSSRLAQIKPNLLPKVRAVTTEMGLPMRPVMPTPRVTLAYESFFDLTLLLLDAKKVQDKLELELEVLEKTVQSGSAPPEP